MIFILAYGKDFFYSHIFSCLFIFHPFLKNFSGNVQLFLDNSYEQPWSDFFSGVNGDCNDLSVWSFQDVVASFDAFKSKSLFDKDFKKFFASQSWQFAHESYLDCSKSDEFLFW